MKTKAKNRRALSALICLLALAALVGLVFLVSLLFKGLSGSGPDMRSLKDVRAVELSSAWSSYFSSPRTREEMEGYLTSSLDEVQALNGNTILLTGRVGADGLFRLKEKQGGPAVAASIEEADKLFNRFEPLVYLAKEAKSRGIQVALLATGDAGVPLTDGAELPAWLQEAAGHYKLSVYSQTTATGSAVQSYLSYTDGPDLLRLDGNPGVLATTWQMNTSRGLVLGELSALLTDSTSAMLLQTYIAEGSSLPTILEKSLPQTLGFLSPDPAASAYGDNIYLIGTSDPSQPLTVNGQEVQRTTKTGVWGLLLPLEAGMNNYSAVQGGDTVTISVKKGVGGGTVAARPDGSVPAQWGQKLRITGTLASLLTEYGNDDAIAMTAYKGGVAEVARSVAFTRGTKKTHAYQLQHGAYVLAKDCELLEPGTPDGALTGLTVSTEGNVEYLTFGGSGTPIYTHDWQGNKLVLNFYSTSFDGQLPANINFGGATVSYELGEHGFALIFEFNEADPLWGYHVDYLDGTTRIALKHQPQRGSDPAKPLAGITVMLDPGHGGNDSGAFGSPNTEVPQEKDLNLAAAKAAQHRLEQLGATVLMTRDTDVFYELYERVDMLNQAKPDFFIAVHHNSTVLSKDASGLVGTECYWFYTEGKPLAQNLVTRVTESTGRPARGDIYNYFYVTRSNICPAVLLETGFVSSPNEFEQCSDVATLWATGGAIAQAVLDSVPG